MLTVSTSPDFAAKWLVHRLGRFAEAYPHRPADLSNAASRGLRTRGRGPLSVTVTVSGPGSCPAVELRAAVAVWSPNLPREGLVCRARPRPQLPLCLSRSQGVVEMARGRGCRGCTYARNFFVSGQHGYRCCGWRTGHSARSHDSAAWDLTDGRLVRPSVEALRVSKTYWMICPKATSNLPKIATFRDWLVAEAHATRAVQS